MAKRLLALVLCLIMLAFTLVGCAKRDEDYKGAYEFSKNKLEILEHMLSGN